GARVAVATVDGRLVARPLSGREAPIAASAAALIVSASRGAARIQPVADSANFDVTVFLSGGDLALGLLARHLHPGRGHPVWFTTTNRDALYALADRRAHIACWRAQDVELRRFHRRLEGEVRVLNLGTIQAGWILAAGNPRGFAGVADLRRAGIRLAN